MASLEIKDKNGKSVGKHQVAAPLGAVSVAQTVLHRAVVAEEANARQGTQSAKTRSETRGGGRKPYKQKKTGNARQGTIRAPHYAHGGMAFAVKPRDYSKKINTKERRAAILGALAAKIEEGSVTVADKLTFAEPKTKQAAALLEKLELMPIRRVLVILKDYDETAFRSFRNIKGVTVRTAPAAKTADDAPKTVTFSTRDVLVAHKILITADALKQVEEVWCS